MKKTWEDVLASVNTVLGTKFGAKEKINLSAEQEKTLNAYGKGFADKFQTEQNERASAAQENADAKDVIDTYMQAKSDIQGLSEDEGSRAEAENLDNGQITAEDPSLVAKLNTIIKDNKKLSASNEKLAADVAKLKVLPDPDAANPETIKGLVNPSKMYNHSATHLFGVDAAYNAFVDRPWNEAAKQASLGHAITAETNWNTANIDRLNQDIQDYYRRDKQEIKATLLDGLVMKKYVQLVSGVSDEYIWSTIATGQITQSLKKAYIPKNDVKFEAEKGKVRDIQIDMTFLGYDLKKLEKSYLKNYAMLGLNGSNPYKETFVRYVVRQIMERARKEDKIVMGRGVYFADPDRTVGADFKNNFDGFIKHILNARAAGKYIPFNVGKPTKTNVFEYVEDMCDRLPYEIKNLPDLQFVLSPSWLKEYKDAYRLGRGRDLDFNGTDVMTVVDRSNIELVAYDQLEGEDLMYITTKDNEYALTDAPSEDGFIQFEKDTRNIKAFGDYKLGTFIAMFGRKQIDGTTGLENQLFFSNDVEALTDTYVPTTSNDATPSLATHHSLIVGEYNTAATDITNLDDAVVGEKVYLYGNPTTDALKSTVKANANLLLNGGDFALSKGNLLVLTAAPGGKFVEFSRKLANAVEEEVAAVLAPDATTADAINGRIFITQANTAATALTNIDNAIVDHEYTIKGGSDTDATTIANTGNFRLSAAMTLDAGTFITVVYNGNQFIELNRG